ncbi:response regulator [Cryomorphaceae bacterium]|nr:response regulator [Cryomorphaceae bacterium]
MSPSAYHKLLKRQVRKHLNDLKELPDREALDHFLEAVSKSYSSFDQDKELSQRMFDIADSEYQEINRRLLEEKKTREQSIAKLIEAVNTLRQAESGSEDIDENLDLLSIADLLGEEVMLRRQIEEALKEAIVETEKAAKAKTEFLSIMSHEIRSPLNAVIGMTHILNNEEHLPSQEENLSVLEISSRNLMLLINDILDFNKIDSGNLELEQHSFDLAHLLKNIRKANDHAAKERGNILKLFVDDELPTSVRGDSARLGQIITNLVSNAVKFTNEGMVRIDATVMRSNDTEVTVRVSVEDEGIGIPEEKLKRIFEPFTQAGAETNRNYGGTGLGLAITKKLLHLMGSSIKVKSSEGQGSTFYFDLTLVTGESVSPETPNSGPIDEVKDLGNARILAVDDLEFNIITLSKIIGKWNIELTTASNGYEAVELVRNKDFDLVLMDLQMPVMDGREATEKIREFNTELPIVALTASTNESTRREVLALGMSDFAGKPFEPDQLYRKLKSHLVAKKEA